MEAVEITDYEESRCKVEATEITDPKGPEIAEVEETTHADEVSILAIMYIY